MTTGISHPLRTDARGQVVSSTGVNKIKESISLIVGTQPGERLMRPNFGCNLQDLVFAPNNTLTADVARHRVTEALRIWEPRIVVDEISVSNQQAGTELIVEIKYRTRATGDQDMLRIPVALAQ